MTIIALEVLSRHLSKRIVNCGPHFRMHSMAFITAPDEEVAKNIARGLVSAKLAACVNIIPKITSVYNWDGKINEDSEVLMMVKTRTSVLPVLTEYVKKHHPYKVCEVISTKILQGNQPYLDWILESVPEKVVDEL
ncbi:protein CutA homolog [Daphnia magna]|uniref:Uncharacterized protein n=1 Tax=Daphnia magna TaxID=35525 RepID=A0ABR0AJD7_9CRUS|nr:protein CutA homolog [Daphnia magna]KAK4025241.1 hypothetical protein OUZ56_014316 [Daphnia magna]